MTRNKKDEDVNDWQDMSTAPKGVGIIEIECTYGVRPWRGLYVWTGEKERDPEWAHVGYTLGWTRLGNPGSGIDSCALGRLKWRTHYGPTDGYVDPYQSVGEFDYFMGERPWWALFVSEMRRNWYRPRFAVNAQAKG